MRNYIALLGWGDADDETLISTDELVKRFRIERVSRNPAQFDEQKLRWMNGRYMRELGTEEITRRLEELTGRSGLHDAVAISEEKIQTLADFWPLAGFIFDGPTDDPAAREKWLADGGRDALADARAALEGTEPFDSAHIEQALRGVVEDARREGQGRLPAGARRTGRNHGLTGHLRDPRGPRARRGAVAHRRRSADLRSSRNASRSGPGLKHPSTPADRGRVSSPQHASKGPDPISMTPPAANVKPIRPTATEAAGAQRRHNEGHGRRLTAAFEALENFPALAESRDRLLRLVTADRISPGDVVAAVESDVALVISVLRLANQVEGRTRGRVESVVEAVELLSPEAVQGLAARARTFDFFERSSVWDAAPERFRLHGVATQRAADRLAIEAGYEYRDRLMVTALLHDIGKLVLMHAYPGYPGQVHGNARTPEERIHRERRELGVDHALVGGVLARRWGLPKSVASVIERHHADDAIGEAAFVRLGDMLAHYSQGSSVSPTELLKCARTVGLGPTELRSVMYDLPYPAGQRTRQIDPCPLSTREVEVLKRLAEGKVYKQIAHELALSTSTVRTHLHNIYGKLGAVDRAQAVLMATERGWL